MQRSRTFSITPVAAAVTTALYPGISAVAQDAPSEDRSRALEEIVVTARKRSESLQDIPATIQAITQESLASMGAKSIEDYARFVPSVNVVSYGSGSATIVFRGAITGPGYIGQGTSSVYLDEISVTQTGAQPDIRPVDINRVEALSGPQGTLYGSDAQAGTMRILTNQPEMNTYEAIFDGEVRGGGQGEASYRGSLVFNVPLIEDKLALRVAAYNDRDGGFIDNVFGHTADSYGLDGDNKAPAQWGTLDNSKSVEKNWNDADIYGARAHLRFEMNDSWAATISGHHQTTDMGADNFFDPFVGDLQVVRFHNDWREEKFNMGSLKIEGDLGFAQLIAATSYYERKVSTLYDITTYAHYWAAQYCHDSTYQNGDYFRDEFGDPLLNEDGDPYVAYGYANPETDFIVWWPVYCQGPTVGSDFFQSYDTDKWSEDQKMSTEIRLSSSGDTLDWILGFYHEDSKDAWFAPFAQPTTGGDGQTNIYQNSISLDFWEYYFTNYYETTTTYPGARMHWWSQSHTDWKQTSVFGEVSWHINDAVELTLGGRYFERSNTNYYLVDHPGGPGFAGEPDIIAVEDRQQRLANNGLPLGRKGSEDQVIPKVSLSWALDDSKMVYGLYTRGVRQGGINRSRGVPFFPTSYDSDIMDNYELGFKSSFGDGRGRFNATAYKMIWQDYQLNLIDPASQTCLDSNGDPDISIDQPGVCGQPWQAIIANAGEAHISGLNVEVDYSLGENWLLGMNYEVYEAETDTSHDLTGDGVNDLTKGLQLPLVPSSKAAAWLEYRQPVNLFGGEEFFIRTQWSYTGDSTSIFEPLPLSDPNPQFVSPSYTIGDLRLGISGEDWEVNVFVNNLTDERAIYTTQSGLFEWGAAQSAEGRPHHQTVYTNRPREVGIRYMKRWGD